MSEEAAPPTEAGFYFVRTGSYQWFNMLVQVHGESPYFKLRAWNYSEDRCGKIELYEIREWGPKLIKP